MRLHAICIKKFPTLDVTCNIKLVLKKFCLALVHCTVSLGASVRNAYLYRIIVSLSRKYQKILDYICVFMRE